MKIIKIAKNTKVKFVQFSVENDNQENRIDMKFNEEIKVPVSAFVVEKCSCGTCNNIVTSLYLSENIAYIFEPNFSIRNNLNINEQ